MEIWIALISGLLGGFAAFGIMRAQNRRGNGLERAYVLPSLLEMQEGDKLLVYYDGNLSLEQMAAIRETWVNGLIVDGAVSIIAGRPLPRIQILRGFKSVLSVEFDNDKADNSKQEAK